MWWMMAAQIGKQATKNAVQLWASKSQAAQMKTQAKQYKQAASMARVAATEDANQREDALNRMLASNINDAAARNVDATEGSSEIVQRRVMSMAYEDMAKSRMNYENQARQMDAAAKALKKQARQTMIGAMINMVADTGMDAFKGYQNMSPGTPQQPAGGGGGGGGGVGSGLASAYDK